MHGGGVDRVLGALAAEHGLLQEHLLEPADEVQHVCVPPRQFRYAVKKTLGDTVAADSVTRSK